MTYQLAEIDLTRHVRTPAGVAYFHKPIGSPIGGGGGAAPRAKAGFEPGERPGRGAERRRRVNDARARSGITYGLSPAEVNREIDGDKRRIAPRADSEPGKSTSKVRPMTPEQMSKGLAAKARVQAAEKQAAEIRRQVHESNDTHSKDNGGHSDPNDNLWQLDNERLQAAIADPRTPPERKRAMKIERGQRIIAVNALLKQKEKLVADPEYKKAIASKDPGRISKALNKHMPVVGRLWDRIFAQHPLSAAAKKIKEADHAQSFSDAVIDFVVKSIAGTATVLLLHFGIGI